MRVKDNCFPSVLFKHPNFMESEGEIEIFLRNTFVFSLQNKSFLKEHILSMLIYEAVVYELLISSYVDKSNITFLSFFFLATSAFFPLLEQNLFLMLNLLKYSEPVSHGSQFCYSYV